MFVCLCNGVTDSRIIAAIENGCNTLKKIQAATGAMTQCCKCCNTCKDILLSTHVHDNADRINTVVVSCD